jgi:hypothetical protein
MHAIITDHRYPSLAAQADCGSRIYHGWMKLAGFNASWRAARASENGKSDLAERENATRSALVPYPWTGIYKAYVH